MSTGDNATIKPGDKAEGQAQSVDFTWSKVAQDLNAPGSKIDKSSADLSAFNASHQLPNCEIIGMQANNDQLPASGHHTDSVQMTENGKQLNAIYNPDTQLLSYQRPGEKGPENVTVDMMSGKETTIIGTAPGSKGDGTTGGDITVVRNHAGGDVTSFEQNINGKNVSLLGQDGKPLPGLSSDSAALHNHPPDVQLDSIGKIKTYNTEAGVKVTLGDDGKPTSYNSNGFTFEHHNDGWYYHQDSGGKFVAVSEPSIASDGTVHTREKGGLNDGRTHSLDEQGEKTSTPEMGTDGLPQPGGGYGSYHYGYEFSTSDKWTQADIAREVEQNYNKYFTLTGDKPSIVPGETINLTLPPELQALGLQAPVKVLAANENGFAFESLPGHFEGAGRTIAFRIVPEPSTEPGKKNWGLEVAAAGPVADTSLIPGTDLGGKGVWQIFDNNLNNRLPDSPPAA